uniref:Uncharacterized protein n=1 Tax=Amphilophus citrinellus TaxID=61819 RepID=A0A3Q0SZ91_AMPCI
MNKGSLNYSSRLSKSAVDLTHKTRPLISSGPTEHGVWKVKGSSFNSMTNFTSGSPTLRRKARVSDTGQTFLYPAYRGHDILHQPQKQTTMARSKQPTVARSLSVSVIDGSSMTELEPKRGRGERREQALVELEEECDSSSTVFNPKGVHLIGQFGKQGSGRADLTLPSGIHATPQGQLFIVDCGNARVQVCVILNVSDMYNIFVLQEMKLSLEAPRGVTVTRLDEFLVADIRKGTLIALKLDPKTGSRLERTVVTGFHRPYLVAACLSSGMVAVSERGNDTGHVPCIKVLEPGWNTVRVLGVCAGMGPVLACPWGICIDTNGNVLVADWGEQHRILLYPAQGGGWPIINQGLSSPRGLSLLPDGQLAVSDSMHHCIKIYQYKTPQD